MDTEGYRFMAALYHFSRALGAVGSPGVAITALEQRIQAREQCIVPGLALGHAFVVRRKVVARDLRADLAILLTRGHGFAIAIAVAVTVTIAVAIAVTVTVTARVIVAVIAASSGGGDQDEAKRQKE
jgi:hypothetical protein